MLEWVMRAADRVDGCVVPLRRNAAVIDGAYCGTVITVPYGPNSIRRACASDQSRGPNGVIQPPACQNELSAATGRKNPPFPEKRGISHQMCSSQYARAGLPPSAAGTPGTAFPTVRISYAERKLATGRAVSARLMARAVYQARIGTGTAGRAVLLDCRQATSISHEFGSRPCRVIWCRRCGRRRRPDRG